MQCIERLTGGFQRDEASGEMGEQHFSALACSWISEQFGADTQDGVV
jgi:hypothetical protein